MIRPDIGYRCSDIVRLSDDDRRARFIASPLEDRSKQRTKGQREMKRQGQNEE
jgi:hypothetical protein